jgi:hypothetical protein
MKQIQNRLGAEGVAAVYRLFEVMTEHFGRCAKNQAVLTLEPPYSEFWLAEELGVMDDDHFYGRSPDIKQLRKFLSEFEHTGLIDLSEDTRDGYELQGDGSKKPKPVTFLTITLPNFAGLVDEYTARKVKKGLATPD